MDKFMWTNLNQNEQNRKKNKTEENEHIENKTNLQLK